MQTTAIYKLEMKTLGFLLLSIFKLHSPKNNVLRISLPIMTRVKDMLGPTWGPATLEPEAQGALAWASLGNTDPPHNRERQRERVTSALLLTFSRSPLVCAVEQRSLPARSIRLMRLVIRWSCSSPSTNSVYNIITGK